MSVILVQQLLAILATLLSVGAIIYTWLTARSRVNETQISVLTEKSSEHDRRLDKVENDLRHLPDKDLTQRMELALADMNGKIAVLNERLQPVAAISQRLQEFMLERAR